MTKLKKYIPYIFIIIFVAWFAVKFFKGKSLQGENSPQGIDWSELDRPSENEEHGSEPESIAASHDHGVKLDEKALNDVSDEADFEAFEQMEESWLNDVQRLLGEKFYSQYLNMRDRNEKEKMQAYNEYHKHLKEKYGDKFSYNISEDQSKRENEINQTYLRELNALIGDRKFKEYLKTRDKVNEENRKRNKLFIQIEF